MFKITFNKPAVKMFFAGEDAVGVQYKVEDGKILFKPVHKIQGRERDVFPVSEKRRGGAEAFIEGSNAGTLLNLLTNPFENDYFILKRRSGGWMEAEPYVHPDEKPKDEKVAPERWEAHIRVWKRGMEAFARAAAPVTKPVIPTTLPPTVQAHEALVQIENRLAGISELSPGRAFVRLNEAMEWINRFRDLVTAQPVTTPRRARMPEPEAQAAFMRRPARRDRAFATAS